MDTKLSLISRVAEGDKKARINNAFYRLVLRSVYKWLNRRSQQSSFNWDEFKKYVARRPIGEPKIYHNFYLSFR